MRILIVRHADPEYHGDTLTEHGHAEALALSEHLCAPREEGAGRLNRIFTSPMGRAYETARYTEERSGIQAQTLEWTRELTDMPRLAGTGRPGEGALALWDIPGEVVRCVPELTSKNQFEKLPMVQAAKDRVKEIQGHSTQLLTELGYQRLENGAYRILKRNRDTIAVFCHGGFGLTWLAILLGLPVVQVWSSFYLAPSSVTTILMDERSLEFAVPRALAVSDTSHLYKAGLATGMSKYEKPNVYTSEPRPSGIKSNYY